MTVLPAKTCTCGTKFVPKSKKHKFCSYDCRKSKKAAPAEPLYILTDVSNHLLSTGPSALSCGVIETQEGESCLIMTIRTQSTTLTIGLSREEAASWIADLNAKVKEMPES